MIKYQEYLKEYINIYAQMRNKLISYFDQEISIELQIKLIPLLLKVMDEEYAMISAICKNSPHPSPSEQLTDEEIQLIKIYLAKHYG